MGEVTITAEEYRELVLKAYKYDKSIENCISGKYTTTFDITDAEKKEMEERSNN